MPVEFFRKCFNCKGKGWKDKGDDDSGHWMGKEKCTVCRGRKGWPVKILG